MERVKQALLSLGIGEEWWKHGSGPRGPSIGLDLKWKSDGECRLATALYTEGEALPLIQKLLDVPEIEVQIVSVIEAENYVEVIIYPEKPPERLLTYKDTPCPNCGVTPKQYHDSRCLHGVMIPDCFECYP